MERRTILLLVLLVIAIVAGLVWMNLNEKPAKAADVSADVQVDATLLFTAFSADEVAAGKLYNDKVVQVTGVVRSIGSEGSGPVNVTLETGDPMGGVVCEFAHDHAPAWKKDIKVTVKGFCAGFNMDVLLQRCAAVE